MNAMPVEVRQLVVRGNIRGETEADEHGGQTEIDFDEFREEILDACRRMIEELLRESRER